MITWQGFDFEESETGLPNLTPNGCAATMVSASFDVEIPEETR